MFGEYIQSNQGTTRDIYGNVRSSAVDGDSPYIVARSNPAPFVEHQQIRDQYLSQLNLVLATTNLDPETKARIRSVYLNEGKETRALIRKITADLKSQRSKTTNVVRLCTVILGAGTLAYILSKRSA